jgi:hypothetical protein
MYQCLSIRKRGTREQCLTRALVGHTLCGRHARMRSPTLWSDVNVENIAHAVRIQALVRGWLVRMSLALGGPGVLSRKNLANDEDLLTCDSADQVHPFQYFAFEESGKIWWFSFETIWRWCRMSDKPVNPYTKVPLTADTKRRLRDIWIRTLPHVPREDPVLEERLRQRWNILSQIFQDNGFLDAHPNSFSDFTAADYMAMFVFLQRDLGVVLPENDPHRKKILWFCQRAIQSAWNPGHCTYILIRILTVHKDPYPLVFSVLSAFYRC